MAGRKKKNSPETKIQEESNGLDGEVEELRQAVANLTLIYAQSISVLIILKQGVYELAQSSMSEAGANEFCQKIDKEIQNYIQKH